MVRKLINNRRSKHQTEVKNEIKVSRNDGFLLLALLFILSGLYYYLLGNYIFFYQENMSLFIYSRDYLFQYTLKPGGLLEYLGNFLGQGYFNNVYGAVVQSVIITLTGIVFIKINKKLIGENSFSLFFSSAAASILLLLQTNINYFIYNNIGLLLVSSYFLISVSAGKKISRILVLVFFPFFFYITGAYAWIYLGMVMIHSLLKKELVYAGSLLIIAFLSLLVFKGFIFLQSWHDLLYYPLPLKDYFSHPLILWLSFSFFAFYPALLNLSASIQIQKNNSRTLSITSNSLVIFFTILILSITYKKDNADLFKLEKMFIGMDWNGVIEYQENNRSRNLVAEYYYNTALSENGMLCDRLFFGPQDYGTSAISIPWNSQIPINKLFRGVYFYYSIGLINEAHRWAYESMVVQGYRPENIKMLIKTDLINGHYKIAEKYINVLKKTLHYRSWAKKYEAMLINPELINSDPELLEKRKLKPSEDFIVRIRNPQKNIASLLQSNPGNKKAFEYMLAWLMLEKNMDGIADRMALLTELGYSRVPGHVEEAALLLRIKTGQLPGINGLKISNETESRFKRYAASISSSDSNRSGGSEIQKDLRNTFWYYLDFVKIQF